MYSENNIIFDLLQGDQRVKAIRNVSDILLICLLRYLLKESVLHENLITESIHIN